MQSAQSLRFRVPGGLTLDYDRTPNGVNDANILRMNLRARNGVVHVIDKVLLPKS